MAKEDRVGPSSEDQVQPTPATPDENRQTIVAKTEITLPEQPEVVEIETKSPEEPPLVEPQQSPTLEVEPSLVTQIETAGITPEATEAFRQKSVEARTWKGVAKKLIEIARSKFGKHPASSTSSPVDYASETNYPEAFAYETNYAGEKYWKLITDLIEKFGMLKGDNHRVLELGCASGNLMELLDNGENKLVGVDISQNLLDIAAIRAPQSTLLVADLNQEGINEELFARLGNEPLKLVIAMDVVEHLDEEVKQDALIAEIYDHLEPGGFLIIGMPELSSKQDQWLRRLFKNIWNKNDQDTTHFNKPTPERFKQLVEKFNILEDFQYFPIPAPIGGLMKLGFSANRLMVLKKPIDRVDV